MSAIDSRSVIAISAGVVVWAGLAFAGAARADCRDPFGKRDQVLEFHLHTTTATWTAFQDSELEGEGCDDQYPYFSAGFRCGGDEPLITIGFRRKRDRSETRAKLPIKLDFNREVVGQRWPAARGALGFRKLTLNSGMADDAGRARSPGAPANPGTLSALLTEYLAWRLMKEELPEASGVAFARVTVHFDDTGATRDQGLYVLIEDIDRTAVRARFGADADGGTLVKTTDLGCVDQVEYDDGPPNAATDLFTTWLAEDPAGFPGTWYQRTDQAMHLDPLLRQEALRELLANTADTVLGNRNNYFALDRQDDRRWYLPWDLDDMFRPFPQVRPPETPFVKACAGGAGCRANVAGQKTRDNPEIRRRYLEIMCQLANGVARESKLVDELLALDRQVRPILAAEVESVWKPLKRDPLDAAVEGTYAAEVERMKAWIPARIQAVRALIEAEGVACATGCQTGAVDTCEAGGHASRRSCVAGAWGPCETLAVGTGGAGGAGAGGAGAGGMTDGTGGRGATGGVAGTDDGGTAEDPPAAVPPGSGGCGCTLAFGPGQDRADGSLNRGTLVLLLFALVARARRRR